MKNPVGGLPRRATIVNKLKEKQPDIIAVEFGDFITGGAKLDRIRGRTYLKSLEYMKYDAISLDSSSFEAGVDFLHEIIEDSSVDFVSLNAIYASTGELLAKPFVTRDIGELKVAVTGLTDSELSAKPREQSHASGHSGPDSKNEHSGKRAGTEIRVVDPIKALTKHLPRLREKADVIVLLSSLTPEKNDEIARRFPSINVMIVNDSAARPGDPDSSVLVFRNTSVKGKELGKISLAIDDQRSIIEPRVTWFRLTKTYAEDGTVLKMLEDFYQTVADDEELWQNIKPVLASYPLESEAVNKYAGSAQCSSCHEQIYQGWEKTKHARAFITLANENKHFQPDCIVCHTTGAGLPSGYKIGQNSRQLEGVQCEVCHGPSIRHISTDGEFRVRTEIAPQLCAQCHNDEVSPDFMRDFTKFLEKVNHSEVPENLRTGGPSKRETGREEGS